MLQREQLAVWFDHMRQLQNPTIAAVLQVMLLTGARPGEVLVLRWEDVNTQWKGLTIRDKVESLTRYGLRRSFASLTEWLEVPAGVVGQIMGHKPNATAKKHYRVSPLELLRIHHERIEAWILEQAAVTFDATAAPGGLRGVNQH